MIFSAACCAEKAACRGGVRRLSAAWARSLAASSAPCARLFAMSRSISVQPWASSVRPIASGSWRRIRLGNLLNLVRAFSSMPGAILCWSNLFARKSNWPKERSEQRVGLGENRGTIRQGETLRRLDEGFGDEGVQRGHLRAHAALVRGGFSLDDV